MRQYTRFTSHAGLAAVGQQMQTWRVWSVIEREVHIQQKVVKHTPTDKLKDLFITLLAGGRGVVEINTRLRDQAGLQRAFGRAVCAEQSTVSDTLNACTPENVAQLRQALQTLVRRHGQAYRHAYDASWQVLDVDLTGLPCGAQAEGAEKGYFAGQRNRRGRQLGRVLASRYDEIVFEQLYSGSRQLEHSLPELVEGAEAALHLTRVRRARTLVRLDGGGGTDDDLTWLLAREYRVLAKVHNWKRAAKLAASVTTWQPDPKEPQREWGWVTQPYPYPRPTQQLALRWPRANTPGTWRYAVLVWNAPQALLFELAGQAPPPEADPTALAVALLAAYDQRGGGVETANKGSKSGLHLHQRNKKRFVAQQMLGLLVELAYNLLTWVRRLLQRLTPALAHFGPLRLVRDVLALRGRVRFTDHGQLVGLTLSRDSPWAAALRDAFQPSLARHGTWLRLGQI
jgi:hypothetical protein